MRGDAAAAQTGHSAKRRIAFVSDPHGDLVALNSVILDLERHGAVDEVLLGGDLAQGGPQPAEVVDRIAELRWSSVRGNADDFLVRISEGNESEPADSAHKDGVPAGAMTHAKWSVDQLGPERLGYLRSLPMSIERGPFDFGIAILVHATPWSTEEVVLPDAEFDVAQRVLREARAGLVAYGHIHTPYQRRIGDAVLLSIGGVNGSNDSDPRPAYTIVELGSTISVEVRRVDCSVEERIGAYERAGVELSDERRAAFTAPGPFPLRSQPGTRVVLWP